MIQIILFLPLFPPSLPVSCYSHSAVSTLMAHEQGTHPGLLLGEVLTQTIHLPPVEAPVLFTAAGADRALYTAQCSTNKECGLTEGPDGHPGLALARCAVKRTPATLRIRQRWPWGDNCEIPPLLGTWSLQHQALPPAVELADQETLGF